MKEHHLILEGLREEEKGLCRKKVSPMCSKSKEGGEMREGAQRQSY